MGSMPSLSARLSAAAVLAAVCAAGSVRAGYFENRRYPIIADETFPADEFILEQARFWYAIYLEVGEDEGLLHDPFYPDLVFRQVKAPGQGRAGSRQAEAQVKALQGEIRGLLAKDTSVWTPEEKALRARFPSFWDTTAIRLSCERIRFQRGLRNKFRAGVERSYRYLPLIDSVFAAAGLPARLKYLPHVESSFYPFAYSKVGAAGMWQFMKSSAKRFRMKVTYEIDERRDPLASTAAAARMLAYNHSLLQSWPLAVTAYNHGPGGLANAARSTGSRDMSTIIKSYYSNTFGFASKNFYAEFLAASSIAMQADSLLPGLRKHEPLRFRHLVLQKPIGAKLICAVTGLPLETLEEYNLALRPAAFRGNGRLPKGFALRLPAELDLAALAPRLSGVAPPEERVARAGGAATAAGSASAAAPARPAEEVSVAARGKAGAGGGMPPVAAAGNPGSPPAVAAEVRFAAGAEKAGSRSGAAHAGVVASAVTDTSPPPPAEAAAEPDKSENLASETDPAGPKPAAKPKLRERLRARLAGEAGKPPETPQPVLAAAPPRNAPPGPEIGPLPAPAETSLPQSAVLSASAPAGPAPLAPAPAEPVREVDSSLAFQASDLDKLAHPMDRFNPAVYPLAYEYADGILSFRTGPEETLSHYAEWAGVSEAVLRKANRLRRARDFRLGRRFRIPLSEEQAREFMRRREENYRAVEEDFYGNYYVSATEPMAVKKGMNLWTWAQEQEIPFWLMQKHNPGKSLSDLHPGDTLNLPLIETGVRKWGFTRYANTREYLDGIARYLAKPKAGP